MFSTPTVHPALSVIFPEKTSDTIYNCAFGYWESPKQTRWTACRETYHSYYGWQALGRSKRLVSFYFDSHTFCWANKDIKSEEAIKLNIARLFWYVERRMGWVDRTTVHHMAHRNHVMIHLSPGWWQNTISSSLSTALMRLGGHCTEAAISSDDDFDNLLGMTHLTKGTKPAIYLFLKGHQHFRGSEKSQWYARFEDKLKCQAKEWLMDRREVEAKAREYWKKDRCPKLEGSQWEPYWLRACDFYLHPMCQT
jgi:hypothetical protein